jgi:hypothetical protein
VVPVLKSVISITLGFFEKGTSMNKREVVWLIVRLIGVYISYYAIVTTFALAASIWMLFSVPSKTNPGVNTELDSRVEPAGIPGITSGPNARPEPTPRIAARPDPAAEEAKREAFKLILWNLFLTVVESGLGVYLLIYGRILFNILMRENQAAEKEKEPESILLNLT